MSQWPKFFYFLQEILKYKYNSILIVSEIDEKLTQNKQFWLVTHRRQFCYIEFLSKSSSFEQVWTSETPFWVEKSSEFDLKRSIVHLPNLVVFILDKQVSQYISFIKFFNKSKIPLVLITPFYKNGVRPLSRLIPFQFFLELNLPCYKIKDFMLYLVHLIKLKNLQLSNGKVSKINSTFFNQASFLKLSERWDSVMSGMQFTKKKSKKDFFIAKNKYNLGLLRKA